jgi:hypothetical protein
MGYYVSLIDTNAEIPAENLTEAYQRLCALNQHNELKTGGSGAYAFGGTPEGKEPISGPHPGVWFSWMLWNYDEVLDGADDILQALGFETITTADGALHLTRYEDKVGAEELFLSAISDLFRSTNKDPVQFVWRGEDGDMWRQVRTDSGKFRTQEGRVVFEDAEPS